MYLSNGLRHFCMRHGGYKTVFNKSAPTPVKTTYPRFTTLNKGLGPFALAGLSPGVSTRDVVAPSLHANFMRQNICFYRPDKKIDWIGIKKKWRAQQLYMKKRKHKNHPRVALRFRLTRFGWERLQYGRYAKKFNLSKQKRKNKLRVKFVARCDLKKLARQMPGHRLRIRDVPRDNNPNIQKVRKQINHYFG